MAHAIALNSVQFNVARIVGPAFGGVLLATAGAEWAFLVNAVSFGAVIVALALMQPSPSVPASATRHWVSEFRDGVRFVRHRRGIVVAIAVAAGVSGLGNPISQIFPVFATKVFRVGPVGYGFLGGALGTGAVVGALVLGARSRRARRSRRVQLALTTYAGALAGFALATSLPMALVALFVSGFAFVGVVTTTNASVQLAVPDEMRGRVVAIYLMMLTATYPLGSLAQGWLVDIIGPQGTVLASAGLLGLVAGVLWTRPQVSLGLDTEHVAPAHAHVAPAMSPQKELVRDHRPDNRRRRQGRSP
jgi:MFS family permease